MLVVKKVLFGSSSKSESFDEFTNSNCEDNSDVIKDNNGNDKIMKDHNGKNITREKSMETDKDQNATRKK